jgi:predicted nucleic acid-binding protein
MAGRIAVDTNVIVAAHLSWHEKHKEALASLEKALEKRALWVSANTLLEAYAVMTRLPAPHRLHPRDAFNLLYGTLFEAVEVNWLEDTELWHLLESLKNRSCAGGKSYDAYILACAVKGKADRFLTFNTRDFEALLSDEEIEIREPE